MPRKSPYRAVVWGPGILGRALLREIAAKPELELAGVLAYSPEKDGKDVGELLGTAPMGVLATTDKEAIHRLDADIVLHCPQNTSDVSIDSEVTNDVVQLLESGKNVISSIAYHWPRFHSATFEEKLQAACLAGGSTLHSTGINPGFLNERLVTTLTGVCTTIESIAVREISDTSTIDSADMMSAIGYGKKPDDPNLMVVSLGDRYYGETLCQTVTRLGHSVERIETDRDYLLAKHDYHLKAITIPEGTIAGIVHKWTAVVDGKPFMSIEEIYYNHPEICPVPMSEGSGDGWTIEIEGQPTSVKVHMDMMHSVKHRQRFNGDDRTLPGYYATAVPMIQTIPVTVAAPPGILYPSVFAHYVPDLRDSPVPEPAPATQH
ncbi:NAD(P)H-dependent amine dehydrogenase family protein [[Mycobacterium] vasticus]|uniref:2,4-diaminopentanoate dehydrogenase C-terminal domain-containing protein n=1 Tax=[Mycobacterium] vasticus TaxID=2875777 RepID=A0ABU5Z186_9MYCO|nr:hypothetical protein [Mycolicibacter sp. MYC017]MEB3071154.1 hypothetical protein [Mycolicibacter sp. MYC017]